MTKAGEAYFEWLLENNLTDLIDEIFYPEEVNDRFNKEWLETKLVVGERYAKWNAPSDHIVFTSRGLAYNTYTQRQLKPYVIQRNSGKITICYYSEKNSMCLHTVMQKQGWKDIDYDAVTEFVKSERDRLDKLPTRKGRPKKKLNEKA